MMWAAGAGGVALTAVALALIFKLASTNRKLGRANERIRNLETGNAWLRAALGSHRAADPTLDDLDGMFDEDADAASDLP